jgi:DNA-binding PadR family transcriptional regulator
MKGDFLGAFEELVLIAVTALGEDAYAAELQRHLEREAKRAVSLGAVHTALERLEAKGCLRSSASDPLPERGGRRRRIFAVTRSGRASLEAMDAVRRRLVRRVRPSDA